MQKVIEQIRSKLIPFIEGDAQAPFVELNRHVPQVNSYAVGGDFSPRLAGRKIPMQNYEKLGKILPISWL